MDAPCIDVDELVVRFGGHVAVDRLSFQVRPGEVFGLLGHNGAGKTTTLRVLGGALRPSAGRVEVAGCRLPQQLARLKQHLAWVPDLDTHLEDLSGRENLQLFARLRGCPPGAVDGALQRLELAEAAEVKVRAYSRGMKKKLMLARELMHHPRVLGLDEPTAHLDRHSVALVRGLIRAEAERGCTVLLSTHDMDEVEALCSRVAVLGRGRLLALDSPARLIATHARRWCDVQREQDGRSTHHALAMDQADDRARLADWLREDPHLRMHTREPRFDEVFRRLSAAAAGPGEAAAPADAARPGPTDPVHAPPAPAPALPADAR